VMLGWERSRHLRIVLLRKDFTRTLPSVTLAPPLPPGDGAFVLEQFPLGAEVVPIYAGHGAITGAVQPAFSIPIWLPQPHNFWLTNRRNIPTIINPNQNTSR